MGKTQIMGKRLAKGWMMATTLVALFAGLSFLIGLFVLPVLLYLSYYAMCLAFLMFLPLAVVGVVQILSGSSKKQEQKKRVS